MLQVLEDLILQVVDEGGVSQRDGKMLTEMNLAWYKACRNMAKHVFVLEQSERNLIPSYFILFLYIPL